MRLENHNAEQLQILQERLLTVSNNTTQLIGLFDPDLRPIYLNPAGHEMLEIPANEPIPDTILVSYPAHVHALLYDEILPTALREGTWSGETVMVTRTGREFPVSLTFIANKNARGSIEYFATAGEDISVRRQAELALAESERNYRQLAEELERRVTQRTAELEAALERAERADHAKSKFLSRMSHELRTPLNSILGFTQILELNLDDPRQLQRLSHITNSGRHLLHLVEEVLDISRVESGNLSLKLQSVPVAQILQNAVDMMRPLLQSHKLFPVTEWGQCARAVIVADPQRLSQVLLNLLSNAIKFNRPGGEVRVNCRYNGSHMVRITVADNGPGIAEEDRSRLFQPFERLPASGEVEGTGLGLAVAKKLVEFMNGRIGLDSIPGQGSTFWVEMPLATEESNLAKSPPGDSKLPAVLNGDRTVLYIEDNQINQQVVLDLLENREHLRLITSTQGKHGLSLALRELPSLILLDLHLPDIHGEEVLRELRSHPATAAVPVIIISADATLASRDRLLAAGAQAYLTKPLRIPAFLELLDQNLH